MGGAFLQVAMHFMKGELKKVLAMKKSAMVMSMKPGKMQLILGEGILMRRR